MTHFEHHSPEVSGLLEITRQLPEEAAIILSRNRARIIDGTITLSDTAVHYEGLNYLSEIYQPIRHGKLIADEFMEAARSTLDAGDDPNGVAYPKLRIINDVSGLEIAETINIAKLIKQQRLPLYSVPARSTKGGESVSVGMDTLIKAMAQEVGVGSVGVVVVEDGSALTVREARLSGTTRLDRLDRPPKGSDLALGALVDPRGGAALSLLQMDTTQVFKENRHRVTETGDSSIEVVLRVGAQPDLQTVMLSLIDIVEAQYMKLEYRNDWLATGEEGAVFSVIDDKGGHLFRLSAEASLDMAIYNAYLTANELLGGQGR